jgi:hypothetical protein
VAGGDTSVPDRSRPGHRSEASRPHRPSEGVPSDESDTDAARSPRPCPLHVLALRRYHRRETGVDKGRPGAVDEHRAT